LDKNQLTKFIDEFIREHRVFAPVKKGKIMGFDEITSGKEACLDFKNTKQSPKSVFFPQTEVLFEYKKGEKGLEEAGSGEGEKILLGIRPCDAKALLLFDKFFSSLPESMRTCLIYKKGRERRWLGWPVITP